MPIVILSTKTKTEGRAACHILPQRTAPGGTRSVKNPQKVTFFLQNTRKTERMQKTVNFKAVTNRKKFTAKL